MKNLSLFAAILVLLLFRPALAQSPTSIGEYTFTLDGDPVAVEVHSLRGTPNDPAPGDVAIIAGWPIRLWEQRSLQFSTDDTQPGALVLTDENGDRVVAVRIHQDYRASAFRNPLAELTEAEREALRGVWITHWRESVEPTLQDVSPHAAISIYWDEEAHDAGILEAIPPRTEALLIDESSYSVQTVEEDDGSRTTITPFGDDTDNLFDSLRRLTHLRVLSILVRGGYPINIATIDSATELRVLRLQAMVIQEPERLARLRELRALDLWDNAGIVKTDFSRRMHHLRQLNLSDSDDPVSLAGLSEHPSITQILADSASITEVPAGQLKALRLASFFATHIEDELLEELRDANPDASIRHDWTQGIRAALSGADRLHVRTGGTCHRQLEKEVSLFELTSEEDIQDLIRRIAIVEARSGFHCRCCGTETFEFYRNGELIETVGFHHGQSLRWIDGWPGDGMLTPASAESLCIWFDKHGVPGPLEEWRLAQAGQNAMEQRMRAYMFMLPQEVSIALQQARSAASAAAAFTDHLSNEEVVILCMRLYGVNRTPWTSYDQIELLVRDLLMPSLEPKSLDATVPQLLADQDAVHGTARWLLEDDHWSTLDGDTLERLIPHVGEAAMTHRDRETRRLAMRTLAETKSAAAHDVLNRVIDEGFEVDTGHWPEGVGTTVLRGGITDLLAADSDATCAAILLLRANADGAQRRAMSLLDNASPSDRELIQTQLATEPE